MSKSKRSVNLRHLQLGDRQAYKHTLLACVKKHKSKLTVPNLEKYIDELCELVYRYQYFLATADNYQAYMKTLKYNLTHYPHIFINKYEPKELCKLQPSDFLIETKFNKPVKEIKSLEDELAQIKETIFKQQFKDYKTKSSVTCKKCKFDDIKSIVFRGRSADEPNIVRYLCPKCEHSWSE